MKKLIGLLLTAILLLPVFSFAGEVFNSNNRCKEQAVYACLIASEKYPVKIVVGDMEKSAQWHAQCFAFKEQQWQPVQVEFVPKVYIGKSELKDVKAVYFPMGFIDLTFKNQLTKSPYNTDGTVKEQYR